MSKHHHPSPYKSTRNGQEDSLPLWLPIPPQFAAPDTLALVRLATERDLVLLKHRDGKRLGLKQLGVHATDRMLKSSANTPRGRKELVAWVEKKHQR